MGFRNPNFADAYHTIRTAIGEISSPYNDGYVGCYCKRELYQLKCWLEDQYNRLPKFAEEAEWEKERIIEKLKNK